MRVHILIETIDGHRERQYEEVDGSPTSIPVLAITYHRGGYSLTHIPTGRALNEDPMPRSQIDALLEEIERTDIPWNKLVDGDNNKLLRSVQLTNLR